MALSAQQIQSLDALSAKIAGGYKANAQDLQNLEYGKARGYVYQPQGSNVQALGAPVQASVTPVSKELQGLDVAAKRKAAGTASATDLENLRYAEQRYGYVYQPGIGGKFTKGSPIPANQLGSNDAYAQLSNILGTQVGPDLISPEIAGLLALQGQTTESEKQYTALQGQLTDLMKQVGNQGKDLQAELDKQGVGQAFQQVKELNLRAAQLQGELQKFDVGTLQGEQALGGQAIPTGLIQGQQAQFNQQRDIARMGKAAELSSTVALSQAYQGNAQLGMQLAQQAIDLKYQPILNNIEVLKTQLSFASEKMSREDAKRSAIIGMMIEAKQQEIAERKAREQQIESIAVEAASYGAPLALVNQIKGASDAATAASIAKNYLGVNVDYRRSQSGGGSSSGLLEDLLGKKFAAAEQIGFSRVSKADGGYDFFYQGKPITVEQYSAGTGMSRAEALQGSTNRQDVEQNLPAAGKSALLDTRSALSIVNELDTLSRAVNTVSFGPTARAGGAIASIMEKLGLNNTARQFESARTGLLSLVARSLGEKGVLTDQDIARVRKLVPSLGDSSVEARDKINRLKRFFNERIGNIFSTYGGVTSSFQDTISTGLSSFEQ